MTNSINTICQDQRTKSQRRLKAVIISFYYLLSKREVSEPFGIKCDSNLAPPGFKKEIFTSVFLRQTFSSSQLN